MLGMDTDTLVKVTRVRDLVRSGAARSIRTGAGLSLGEVGRTLGCSASTVLRWEAGERTPRGDLAVRYGELLNTLLRRGGS